MKEGMRNFMWGAFIMLLVLTFVRHNSVEVVQYREVAEMKARCEKDLPRSENCVIVVMPKSKD